ncbi:MAG: hypothetical protein IKV59_03075 [Lachnospiraceae bacterium]|nr:hypothetical protein [Lachnospiraceae bacterium]
MKACIDLLSIGMMVLIGYLLVLWGGGTLEQTGQYLQQVPWILLFLVMGMILIFCFARKADIKQRYVQVLFAFIRYLCISCAFRARMGSLTSYYGMPEFEVFFLITLCVICIFKMIQMYVMTKLGCFLASMISFILLFVSMGANKTGIKIQGVSIQMLILVVVCSLVVIFPWLLGMGTMRQRKKRIGISFVLLAVQCMLFLKASECGTMLVLLVSFWMIWMRFCKIQHMRKIQFLSSITLVFAGGVTFSYIKYVYGKFIMGGYAGKDLSLMQNIAVKAAKRLFQTDPYQYELGIKAVWRGGLLGKGREFLVNIPNAVTDLPLLHSIQIFGWIALGFILFLLLHLMRTMVFANCEETAKQKDGYSQLRDEAILGFFLSSILINLFSETTGVIIGIPLLFLSRASSWNLVACILLAIYISTPDMTMSAVKNLKDKYARCLNVGRG